MRTRERQHGTMEPITQAWAYFEREDYLEAEQAFRTLLQSADTLEGQQQARYGLGYVLAFANRFDEATDIFNTVRVISLEHHDRVGEHRAVHQLGMVARMAEHWITAKKYFEEEHVLIEALGNEDLAVAINAYEQGMVRLQLPNEWNTSKAWFERSLKHALRSDDLIAIACAHRGMGDWHWAQADVQSATASFTSSRDAFASAKDVKGVTETEQRLASLSSNG
jgi:tetratricopeptide (TPR) repeat protein